MTSSDMKPMSEEERKYLLNQWARINESLRIPNLDWETNAVFIIGILGEIYLAGRNTRPSQGDGWISVKERLPEEGEFVLFASETITPRIRVGFYRNDDWRTIPAWLFVMSVTHWMPLPAPPRKDENK